MLACPGLRCRTMSSMRLPCTRSRCACPRPRGRLLETSSEARPSSQGRADAPAVTRWAAGAASSGRISNLAGERRLPQIEKALRTPSDSSPPASPSSSFRRVSLRLRDGRSLQGLAKYQSAFDVGLQTRDGRFLSVSKASVAEMSADPPLPAHTNIPVEQAPDLMAYLTRLVTDRSARATLKGSSAGADGSGAGAGDDSRPRTGEWPTYNGNVSGNRHSPLRRDRHIERGPAVAGVDVPCALRDGRAAGHAGRRRRLDVCDRRQRGLGARRANGPAGLALQPSADAGLVGDPAAGINRGVAVARRSGLPADGSRAPHRASPDRPASCCGTSRWPTIAITTARRARRSSSKDLVIAGVSGGDEGIRGFLDAYRASTGERVWRFWTVPARGEPGSETWIGKALEHGCATTWLTGTYDPDTRLAVLAHGQSVSRLQRRRAQGRQPVLELGARARP